jgi:16S rRNA (uracil1498-N3)-methyltransferase
VTAADVEATAHVFVADIEAPVLSADDRHHLSRVLRVRDGDVITLSDGRGRWCVARMGRTVAVDGAVHDAPAPRPRITIALALVKGGRPELAVQKLTELGVDRIALFAAERSVVRWDEGRAARQVARLAAVAREAAMQSRRVRLPDVEVRATFDSLIALPGACLAQRGGAAPSLDRATVLVGPEGGWSPDELAASDHRVELSDGVLRSETAAITAGALLCTLRARAHDAS